MNMGIYRYPTIPGHELSGEVVACGLDVKKAKMPEKVTVAGTAESEIIIFCEQYSYTGSRRNGAFAEYVKVVEMNLVRLSENVGFDLGAMTDPAAMALPMFLKHKLRNRGCQFLAFGKNLRVAKNRVDG